MRPSHRREAAIAGSHQLLRLADDNNIEAVTRKINGGLNGFKDRLSLCTRAALALLGYTLERGAVLDYQRAARFTGRDLDDIPGPRTRAAIHGDLKAAEPLAFGPANPPSAASPPADWFSEISAVREALADAERRLAAMLEGSRRRGAVLPQAEAARE